MLFPLVKHMWCCRSLTTTTIRIANYSSLIASNSTNKFTPGVSNFISKTKQDEIWKDIQDSYRKHDYNRVIQLFEKNATPNRLELYTMAVVSYIATHQQSKALELIENCKSLLPQVDKRFYGKIIIKLLLSANKQHVEADILQLILKFWDDFKREFTDLQSSTSPATLRICITLFTALLRNHQYSKLIETWENEVSHFSPMVTTNQVIISTVFASYVKLRHAKGVQYMFQLLAEKNLPIDSELLNYMLQWHVESSNFMELKNTLQYAIRQSIILPPEVYIKTVKFYVHKQHFEEALELVDYLLEHKLLRPSMALYSLAIVSSQRVWALDKALKYFEDMQQDGLKPDANIYNNMIEGCCKYKDGAAKAIEYLKQFKQEFPHADFSLAHVRIMHRLYNDRHDPEFLEYYVTYVNNSCKVEEYNSVIHQDMIKVLVRNRFLSQALQYCETLKEKGLLQDENIRKAIPPNLLSQIMDS